MQYGGPDDDEEEEGPTEPDTQNKTEQKVNETENLKMTGQVDEMPMAASGLKYPEGSSGAMPDKN